MAYPADRKYTKEHEWIQVNGNSAAVGITDYAQESLGDIVFVETPKVGAELTLGKTFGTVESVKAVSDLFAPAFLGRAAVNVLRGITKRKSVETNFSPMPPAQWANATPA